MSTPSPPPRSLTAYVWEETYASPETSLAQVTSGSTSSRSRRTHGSSEDTTDGISLRVQSFRVGGPTLPPVGTAYHSVPMPSATGHEWEENIKPKTEAILRQHDVAYDRLSLVYYPTEYISELVSYPRLTVLIRAEAAHSEREWIPVAEAVIKYLTSIQQPDINVELYDKRAHEPTLSYPVVSTDPVISLWESAKKEIVNCLSDKHWISLSLLRRGKRTGSKPVTAVITISKSSNDDWVAARDAIIEILDSHSLGSIGIEIIRGEEIIQDDKEDRLLLDEGSFNVRMSMGRSIGPRKSTKHPSTFGGFVRVKIEGQWRLFGLTCFHCVAPKDINHSSINRWRRHGIFSNDLTNDLQMDSPSRGDTEETERALNSRIKETKNVEFQEIKRKLNDPMEFVTPGQNLKHTKAKEIISALEKKLRTSQEFFHNDREYLGRIYAGSGLRTIEAKAVDWALIEMNDKRVSENLLPDMSSVSPKFIKSSFEFENVYVAGIGSLEPDMDLFKIGRSTDFTVGRMNGVRTTELLSWRQESNGSLTQVYSDAYCVVPSYEFNPTFSQGGDSGSFVLNKEGKFVGILFGGSSDGTSFFTSAEDLQADIGRVTGATELRFGNEEGV